MAGQGCTFPLRRAWYFYVSPFLGKISMIWSLRNLTQNKINASKVGAIFICYKTAAPKHQFELNQLTLPCYCQAIHKKSML